MRKADRAQLLDYRVSRCIDPVDLRQKVDKSKRKHNITFEERAYDGRWPPVPGWPEHPKAPQVRPPARSAVG